MAKQSNKSKDKAKGKKKPGDDRVSYYKKPGNLETARWQIQLRKQFAETQNFILKNVGDEPVYSDFLVSNPEYSSTYKVAIRSREIGQNFCSCPDFKTNTLGTCKHIEWTLLHLEKQRGNKTRFKNPPERTYSSVFLHYGEKRSIRIRIGSQSYDALNQLAKKYFDAEGEMRPDAYLVFDKFLKEAKAIAPNFKCYDDALEFILLERENQQRALHVEEISKDLPAYLSDAIKVKLFPYQLEGVKFAAKAGRCLIADEMGLGKTVQAIAAAALLQKEQLIGSVLIVCPTSLKYQWKKEIEKFTQLSAKVIEGAPNKREVQYKEDPSFFKILTYNMVGNDLTTIKDVLQPDLIILDEAQRIKNWNTKISRAVKSLDIRYRFVLTGTPLENKIEELYSIAQYVDPYALGPLHAFMERHTVIDPDSNMVKGYRDLGKISRDLAHIMIRRNKKTVLTQLPERMDKNLFVPMTAEQQAMHNSYETDVAQLIAKWRKFHFLNEQDRLKLLKCLNVMKMSCDSTYIVDQQTRHDTKVDELMCILEEAMVSEDMKVVIFSQWERMTRLVAQELEAKEIKFENLHGGVHSEERGKMLDRFEQDPEIRIFLSTDAGGVGLNLQKASLLINLDIPWNPAVLEQRVARIYRMGQTKRVNVINLISVSTIEHGILGKLKFKSSMAAGVLDQGDENVFLSKDSFNDFMNSIEDLTNKVVSGEAAEFEPITDQEEVLGNAVPDEAMMPEKTEVQESEPPMQPIEEEDFDEKAPQRSNAQSEGSTKSGPQNQSENTPNRDDSSPENQGQRNPASSSSETSNSGGSGSGNGSGHAAPPSNPQELIGMGISFLSGLTQTLQNPQKTAELVNSLVQKDEHSGQTYLKIPVQNQEVVNNALQVLGSLFGAFKG